MAKWNAPKIKAGGTFQSNRGTQGINFIIQQARDQAKDSAAKEEIGEGAIPISTTTTTGTKYENPENIAKVESEKAMGQRISDTASSRSVMRNVLIKGKRLTDTVPPAPTGIQKYIQGAKTAIKGETGEIPQIKEFNRMIDSSLSNFSRTMNLEKGAQSNQDIARIKKGFSDIVWDTEDQRALGWDRFIDTYNDVIGSYKSLQNETIDKRELLSPKEIGRARFLSGSNQYEDLTDDEMEGVFEGDIETIPKPFLEKAVQEYEKRGLHKKESI